MARINNRNNDTLPSHSLSVKKPSHAMRVTCDAGRHRIKTMTCGNRNCSLMKTVKQKNVGGRNEKNR